MHVSLLTKVGFVQSQRIECVKFFSISGNEIAWIHRHTKSRHEMVPPVAEIAIGCPRVTVAIAVPEHPPAVVTVTV